jgi:hypothetical protein
MAGCLMVSRVVVVGLVAQAARAASARRVMGIIFFMALVLLGELQCSDVTKPELQPSRFKG